MIDLPATNLPSWSVPTEVKQDETLFSKRRQKREKPRTSPHILELQQKIEQLQAEIAKMSQPLPDAKYPVTMQLHEVEKAHILKVLEHCGNNKAVACRILGVTPKTIYNRLEKYELKDQYLVNTKRRTDEPAG